MKSKPFLTVLIILMMTAGLFLTIGAMGYAEHNEQKIDTFYDAYSDDEYRYFVEAPIGMNIPQFVTDLKTVEAYSEYYRELNESDKYEYYHYRLGEVAMIDLKIPDICLTGYTDFNAYRNYSYNEVLGGQLSAAQGYEIDPAVFGKFKITPILGRDFSGFM